MIENWMFVAIGGCFGALARYGLSHWVNRRYPSVLPRATLFINVSGSFLLGLLMGANWGNAVSLLLGAGFMGAYTTFSTFNVENVQLLRNKQRKVLSIYLLSSYVGGILLAYVGVLLGTAIRG